eukprot:RCo043862
MLSSCRSSTETSALLWIGYLELSFLRPARFLCSPDLLCPPPPLLSCEHALVLCACECPKRLRCSQDGGSMSSAPSGMLHLSSPRFAGNPWWFNFCVRTLFWCREPAEGGSGEKRVFRALQ